jgi:Multicopper oxidase
LQHRPSWEGVGTLAMPSISSGPTGRPHTFPARAEDSVRHAPFHLRLRQFYFLCKDTVIAYPGEITRVKALYDLPGFYVWHCHIVEHEDNEMMRPFHVGPIPQDAPAG